MSRHNQKHLLTKPLDCPSCNSNFTSTQALKRHVVEQHEKATELQCAHCPYFAKRKSNIVRHLRQHAKTLKRNCDGTDTRNAEKIVKEIAASTSDGTDARNAENAEKNVKEIAARFKVLVDVAAEKIIALGNAMPIANHLISLTHWLDTAEQAVQNMELVPADGEEPNFYHLKDIVRPLLGLVGADEVAGECSSGSKAAETSKKRKSTTLRTAASGSEKNSEDDQYSLDENK